jgi:cysteinyl-tRNA synthetase
VALENFGSRYDIHGGAKELAYPHHDAHLAQYKALTGIENPVQRWMYVGLVFSNGEKMSKSLGNMVLARQLVEKYGQNLVRLYLFSTHYSEDLDYNEESLSAKKTLLEKIYHIKNKTSDDTSSKVSALINEFLAALDDDLNSPKALQAVEHICDLVLENNKISIEDFEKIINILGLSV